jgi:hypothetical protein
MKVKIYLKSGPAAAKRGEGGMATVIFIALLAIMMILIMVESSSLIRLRREVKLLEQQQIKRLNGPQTNIVASAIYQAK